MVMKVVSIAARHDEDRRLEWLGSVGCCGCTARVRVVSNLIIRSGTGGGQVGGSRPAQARDRSWSNRQGPGSTEARTLAAPSRTGVDKVEGEGVTLAQRKGTSTRRELEL